MWLYILIGVVAVLILWIFGTYNKFVILTNRAKEALSDIDVQLKRRFDLIPNLVETVKGYASHEQSVLENVTKARAGMMQAGTMGEKLEANNQLAGTLKTLFAVSENYPDLKASANFVELQRELTDTEDKVQASRRFYNGNVKSLNIKVETVPSNMIASMFKIKKMDLFEAKAEEKEPVKVQF
jgi:LemA protein